MSKEQSVEQNSTSQNTNEVQHLSCILCNKLINNGPFSKQCDCRNTNNTNHKSIIRIKSLDRGSFVVRHSF